MQRFICFVFMTQMILGCGGGGGSSSSDGVGEANNTSASETSQTQEVETQKDTNDTQTPTPSQSTDKEDNTSVSETSSQETSATTDVNNTQTSTNKTYYIRADGGTYSRCDGLSDAPLNDSGNCAWSHPFEALGVPVYGAEKGHEFDRSTYKRHIKGGDTLIIKNGSYRMGCTKGVYSGNSVCSKNYPYGCKAGLIPSGTAENPTKILGENWNKGCSVKPELFGVEKVYSILDASGDYIQIECLNITDHETCISSHGVNADPTFTDYKDASQKVTCKSEKPDNLDGDSIYGNYGSNGIIANSAHNLTIKNVEISGLAANGLLSNDKENTSGNWVLENVNIHHNGWAGWDGRNYEGSMVLKNTSINFNGCALTYPGGETYAYWGQATGGYGDGIGLSDSVGNWVLEDVDVSHNTSDGIDLLYLKSGSTVSLNRVHAEGNAGNQVKVSASKTTIKNSVVVGNCGYFDNKDFVYGLSNCRAGGSSISMSVLDHGRVDIENLSIYGEGDSLFSIGSDDCDGSEVLRTRNVVGLGDLDFLGNKLGNVGDKTSYLYNSCQDITIDHDEEYLYNLKPDKIFIYGDHEDATDKNGSRSFYKDPQFVKIDNENDIFDLRIQSGSEALGYGAYDANGVLKN